MLRVVLSREQRDAVLAGLRLLQNHRHDLANTAIGDIATGDNEHDILSDDQIDDLCEHINR